MQHYFAIFYPLAEGGYMVDFPDIPEAFSEGADLDECMRLGAEVLAMAVEEYAKARKDLPPPSSLEAVKEVAANGMAAPGTDASRAPLLQLFAAPRVDMTPVRISVSLPKSVLEDIDRKAQQQGLTRSGFLARAASAFEQRQQSV